MGGPLVLYNKRPSADILLLFISYGFLVLSNVLTYSYFEYDQDREDQERSLATTFGKKICKRIIYFSLMIAGMLLIVSLLLNEGKDLSAYVICTLMSLAMLSIYLAEGFFRTESAYGIVADAAFLLPILALIIE